MFEQQINADGRFSYHGINISRKWIIDIISNSEQKTLFENKKTQFGNNIIPVKSIFLILLSRKIQNAEV